MVAREGGLRSPVLWDQPMAQLGVGEGFASHSLKIRTGGLAAFCSAQSSPSMEGLSFRELHLSVSAAAPWIWSKKS